MAEAAVARERFAEETYYMMLADGDGQDWQQQALEAVLRYAMGDGCCAANVEQAEDVVEAYFEEAFGGAKPATFEAFVEVYNGMLDVIHRSTSTGSKRSENDTDDWLSKRSFSPVKRRPSITDKRQSRALQAADRTDERVRVGAAVEEVEVGSRHAINHLLRARSLRRALGQTCRHRPPCTGDARCAARSRCDESRLGRVQGPCK
jgi:hypothetical protein